MVERVLLVEDDELLGVLFELALAEAGYLVARADNGSEALAAIAAASRIDLVVTDVSLGNGPDGWQVARRARARSPDVPVIYMTGGRGDEWRPQHVPFGVLLLKPFPIDELVETAGRLMAARAETAASQKSA